MLSHKTDFIEMPELNIPKLDPYESSNSFSIATSTQNVPVKFTCQYWNVALSGIDSAVVKQIRYLGNDIFFTG